MVLGVSILLRSDQCLALSVDIRQSPSWEVGSPDLVLWAASFRALLWDEGDSRLCIWVQKGRAIGES